MNYRVKCSKCGNVLDVTGSLPCPKCGTAIDVNLGGMIQLYRMGSPIGVAAGYGIYLDGQPIGHIANKQSLLIPIPFGNHQLHMTCGMTRRCQDLLFNVAPESPNVYVKAHIKPGFWTNTIIVEFADPAEMPKE